MPRWRDVRIPHAALIVAGFAAAVAASVLHAARRFDFFYDEWDFVLAAPYHGAREYFLPHNSHWVTLPKLAYTVLLSATGAGSYRPFIALLLLLHASAGLLLFLIARRRAGDLPAVLAAVTLLVLSRGWENILWAFQIAFAGAVVFGLLALYLLDDAPVTRSRLALASVASTLGLMCSGIGVVFLAVIAAELLLDRRRRSGLIVLAAPIVAYATWYVWLGRSGTAGLSLSPAGLLALTSYVPAGIGAVAAGVVGLGPRFGPPALAVLTAALAIGWIRAGRVESRALAAAAGLVAQFTLAGLARWQLGSAQAASPRYVYVGAIFLMLILAGVLRDLPWRGLWKLAPWVVVPILALNVVQLGRVAITLADQIATQATMLRTVWLFRDAPGLDRDAVVDPVLMPQVRAGSYVAFRRRFGSSLPETTLDELTRLPAPAVNRALASVFPPEISAVPSGEGGEGCAAAVGSLDLTVASGAAIVVRSPDPGTVELTWWLAGPAPAEPVARREVAGATALRVRLADAGPAVRWRVRVRPPPGSSVCGPTDGPSR